MDDFRLEMMLYKEDSTAFKAAGYDITLWDNAAGIDFMPAHIELMDNNGERRRIAAVLRSDKDIDTATDADWIKVKRIR